MRKRRWLLVHLTSVVGLLGAATGFTQGRPPEPSPAVDLVDVNVKGETISPTLSSPDPIVILDPVKPEHVKPLDMQGRAEIRVAGTVTDALADIVPGGAADIVEVEVRADDLGDPVRLPVRRTYEKPTPARPFAFHGRFEGTIVTRTDLVVVEAANVIGERGSDSLDVEVDAAHEEAVASYTGNDPLTKFMDAYTFVPVGPDEAPDRVVLYPGAHEATGAETPLARQAGSLSYAGATRELGKADLTIQERLPAFVFGDRRAFLVRFDATSLFIWDQDLQFVETHSGSGVYRSAARRLPDNQVLEVTFAAPPTEGHRDQVRVRLGSWQAFSAEAVQKQHGVEVAALGRPPEPLRANLEETASASNTYTGDVRGLGRVTLAVLSVRASTTLEVFLASSTLGVRDLLLRLEGEQSLPTLVTGAWTFRTRAVGPEQVEVRPESMRARVTGVRQRPGRVANRDGRFHPFWVVLSGATRCPGGLHGSVDGHPVELTRAAGPWGREGLRFALPFVLVQTPPRIALANVLPGLEDSPSGPQPRAHEFTVTCAP